MLLLSERIQTFAQLGDYLTHPQTSDELDAVTLKARSANSWFTPANSQQSLHAIARQFLNKDALTRWTEPYALTPSHPQNVGLVMAGNIPAVGFHDLLSVLISGHRLFAKLSSQDFVLIQYLIQKITEINPGFADYITVADRLNGADAFIATGSDNTARYFEYYFSKKPHIIRKNRTSVAVLTGEETDDELRALGHDILDYFGLGCRNVSTLFVPQNYSFIHLLDLLEPMMETYRNHHKFVNNYDYNKSIYLVNGVPHYDNGFLLITENDGLVSPISVVYYQTYASGEELNTKLAGCAEKIQCVVSSDGAYPNGVHFGQTQEPSLTDYADGINTLAFLNQL